MADRPRNEVARGFTTTSSDYDEVVRHNIHGAERLIGSLPDGDYERVLDVGCGTGFASLAMIARFGSHSITGVDPSAGMLEQFRSKLDSIPDTDVALHEADVLAMPVEAAAYDAVICSMAFHWFPRKAEATIAMGRALRPGGHLAILCSGRDGEHEFRDLLRDLDPPVPHWLGAFDVAQRGVDDMHRYLERAGLEPVDVWMESRIRHTPVEAYLERMRVVASHVHAGSDPDELAQLQEHIAQATHAAAGPRGFRYTFNKLFAIARRPPD